MRKVLPFFILPFLCNNVFADEAKDKKNLKLTIKGEINSTLGLTSQKPEFQKQVSDDNKLTDQDISKNAISNSGTIKFYADYLDNNDFGYGAYVKLNANTSKSPSGSKEIAQELKIYLQSNYGKFELGSTSSAMSELSVNPYDLARATGGLDGDASGWFNAGFAYGNDKDVINNVFITEPKLLLGYDNGGKSNKINYYTPVINGFTFGVSYVPDGSAKGTIASTRQVPKSSKANAFKNIIQPGIKYQGRLSDNVTFATSVTSEFGKAKDYKYKNGVSDTIVRRNNLAAWQVGGMLNIYDVSFAASYGNNGKSGTKRDQEAGKKYLGNYWSVGSAFAKEKYGISVNYMESRRAGYIFGADDTTVGESSNNSEVNKFTALSIGADYKVMEGLMPYIEYTKFNFHKNNNFTSAMFNDGHVVLVGTKLQF